MMTIERARVGAMEGEPSGVPGAATIYLWWGCCPQPAGGILGRGGLRQGGAAAAEHELLLNL